MRKAKQTTAKTGTSGLEESRELGMQMGLRTVDSRLHPLGILRFLHTPRINGNFIDAIRTDISLPKRNYLLGCHYPKIDSFSAKKDRKSICPSS